MKKEPSLRSVRDEFDSGIQSAVQLYCAAEKDARGHWHAITGWAGLYPGHARRIVALAFMQMVIAWEELVEGSLIRYLAGAPAPSGYRPRLRIGPAKSLAHAYQLISGNPKFEASKHFLSWDSWGSFVDTAALFLEGAEPFSKLTPLQRERLHDAKKIRNRVAHFSQKVRKDFAQIAKKHLGIPENGKLKQGYDVGQLLVDESSKGFGKVKKGPYFIHYANLMLAIADIICPPKEPKQSMEGDSA